MSGPGMSGDRRLRRHSSWRYSGRRLAHTRGAARRSVPALLTGAVGANIQFPAAKLSKLPRKDRCLTRTRGSGAYIAAGGHGSVSMARRIAAVTAASSSSVSQSLA
jgi:hypothetical protein